MSRAAVKIALNLEKKSEMTKGQTRKCKITLRGDGFYVHTSALITTVVGFNHMKVTEKEKRSRNEVATSRLQLKHFWNKNDYYFSFIVVFSQKRNQRMLQSLRVVASPAVRSRNKNHLAQMRRKETLPYTDTTFFIRIYTNINNIVSTSQITHLSSRSSRLVSDPGTDLICFINLSCYRKWQIGQSFCCRSGVGFTVQRLCAVIETL